MAMDEQHVKLMARVMAQELVVTSTTVRLYRLLKAMGVPFDLKADREMLKRTYASLAIPGIDPAWSDVLSSELTHALDELLGDIIERLDRPD